MLLAFLSTLFFAASVVCHLEPGMPPLLKAVYVPDATASMTPCALCTEPICTKKGAKDRSEINSGYSVSSGWVYQVDDDQGYWMVNLKTNRSIEVHNYVKTKFGDLFQIITGSGIEARSVWTKVKPGTNCQTMAAGLPGWPKYMTQVVYWQKKV